MKTQIRKSECAPAREFFPLILGKEFGAELNKQELSKLDLFEKGLANELDPEESIEQSVTRMVKMALAAEFGASLVAAKGAQKMVSTITKAIMCDPQLRKQALIVISRFANNG